MTGTPPGSPDARGVARGIQFFGARYCWRADLDIGRIAGFAMGRPLRADLQLLAIQAIEFEMNARSESHVQWLSKSIEPCFCPLFFSEISARDTLLRRGLLLRIFRELLLIMPDERRRF